LDVARNSYEEDVGDVYQLSQAKIIPFHSNERLVGRDTVTLGLGNKEIVI
jgi:hypothetical protein